MRRNFIGLVVAFYLAAAPSLGVAPKVDIPPLQFQPEQVDRHVLSNGVVVYLREDHELPLLDLNIRIKTSLADQRKFDELSFLGAVWRVGGTKSRTPDALNEELEFLPASVETGADEEGVSVSLSCLSKHSEKGLGIFLDVLLNPVFDAEQLALAKGKSMEALRRKNETPAQIARRAFRDAVYGKEHAYAYEPTTKSLLAVTRTDLLDLHKKIVTPDRAMMAVAGDFETKEMLERLEKLFASWKTAPRIVPSYDYSIRNPSPEKIFVVDKQANQSRITIGRLGVARHHPDHFGLVLADYILGGGGPSRLFGEIRSRQGLAYVVGSFLQEPLGQGLLGVGCQTQTPSTIKAVKAILSELKKFSQGPISANELQLAKDYLINSYVFSFDSPFAMVAARASNEFYGYSSDYLEIYTSRLANVTKEEVERLAKKYYAPETMKIMIVGDEKNFDAPVDSLGPTLRLPLEQIN